MQKLLSYIRRGVDDEDSDYVETIVVENGGVEVGIFGDKRGRNGEIKNITPKGENIYEVFRIE